MRTVVALLAIGLTLAPLQAGPDPIHITGRPASPEFVARVLSHHGITATPGAALAAGRTLRIADQEIVNDSLPDVDPVVLGFSDHPERVAESGVLFWGGVLPWKPVRLMYYHEGAPGHGTHVLSLFADNPTDQPLRFHVIAAAAGPEPRPIAAGHASTRDFLQRLAAQEGEVLTLAPGQMVELAQHMLPEAQTVSGYAQLTLLTPGRLNYHVISRNRVEDAVSFPTVENPNDVHARGAYTVARIHTTRVYVMGAPDAYVSIGNHAPGNVLSGKALAGDYGVTYAIDLTVVNPDAVSHELQLSFTPRGGGAAASFLVNGRLIEVPATVALTTVRLLTAAVSPHGRCTIHVLTMPEGASSYPVRLGYGTARTIKETGPPVRNK